MNDANTKGRIQLSGFEDALIKHISENFRFEGEHLKNVKLVVGRHLFVQDMPPTDALVEDAKAVREDYDPERDPTISVFTTPNQNVAPSLGRGGRHEWQLRVVMRLGTVLEECKARLEELTRWLDTDFRGAYIDRYAVKGVLLRSRPSSFKIDDSEQAYCEVQLRLFAVPRVTA